MANFTYRLSATGRCPVDGAADTYEIEIVASQTIYVEDILSAVSRVFDQPTTQEAATLSLRHTLPGSVRIRGMHSGVEVESFAP